MKTADEDFCQGECDEHFGPVVTVRVFDDRPQARIKDWGLYKYCDSAIKIDRKRGFRVEGGQAMTDPFAKAVQVHKLNWGILLSDHVARGHYGPKTSIEDFVCDINKTVAEREKALRERIAELEKELRKAKGEK